MTGLSFLLFHYETVGVDTHVVGIWLIGLSTIASLWSGFDYLRSFVRHVNLQTKNA